MTTARDGTGYEAGDDLDTDALRLSLEVFPPRAPDSERQLTQALERLLPLNPRFVSVTYGAGGSSQERSFATIARIKRQWGHVPAAHLTCVGADREGTDKAIARFLNQGVRHFVALRGDEPGEGAEPCGRPGSSYESAADLVRAIRRQSNATISVAAYPDRHPRAASDDADFNCLLGKFEAGADQAITQFFFQKEGFLQLRDRLAAAGIDKPLIAGILPIHDFAQTKRFARRCGAEIPEWIHAGFARAQGDDELTRLFALSLAIEQVRLLVAEGVRDFHIYTLNRAGLTADLVSALRESGTVAITPALRSVQ